MMGTTLRNVWAQMSASFGRTPVVLGLVLVAALAVSFVTASSSAADAEVAAPNIIWMSGAHAGGVGRAAISPDGQILATADYGEVSLWRYSDGQLLKTLPAVWIDAIKAIKFSPDGQYVYAGGSWIPGSPSNQGTLRMWRVSDGAFVRDLNPGAHYDVRSISLSADGKVLAVATSVEKVLVFDSSTGALVKTLESFAGNAVAVSPDGSLVAATGADQFGDPSCVNVWRTSDGVLVTKLFGLNFISDSVAFSPNGQYLAAGDWGGNGTHGKVMVWLTTGFLPVRALTTNSTGSIYNFAFSNDSQSIAAGGTEGLIWQWRIADGALIETFEANIEAIWNIIFSGETLFAGGSQNISHIFRLNDGERVRSIGGDRAFVTSVAFSPDGQLFANSNGHNPGRGFFVEVYQAANGDRTGTVAAHGDIINSIAFSPDGQRIASASGSQPPDTRDTRIFISPLSGGAPVIIPGHSGGTISVAYSPDGSTLASSGRDNAVRLWSPTGTLLRVLNGHNKWVSSVAFSPDGQTIASGAGDAKVKLWRASDGSLIRTIPGNGYPVGSVSFSPDGQLIALTANDEVQVWNANEGTLVRTLDVHPGHSNLSNVLFSRDGNVVMVASGSYTPTIWFWSLADGGVLQTYGRETGFVQPPALAISPDNTLLGIGRYDAVVEMARYPIASSATPTPTPVVSPSPTPTPTPTSTPTPTPIPSPTPDATPSPSPTPTPTSSPTPSPTPTPALLPVISVGPLAPFSESSPAATVVVYRSGDLSQASTVDYITSDETAREGRDYEMASGTLRFEPGESQKTITMLLINDGYAENDEAFVVGFTNPRGAVLGMSSQLAVTVEDNDPTSGPNPADSSSFLVRQHYLDFFGRESDPSGQSFWTTNIESCNSDAGCREVKRIDTSAAFFLSTEFEETGYLLYRTYKVAFGNMPAAPVPLRFEEFLRDTARVGRDVVVNQAGWQQRLENNKTDFMREFVARQRFTDLYPANMSAADFVAMLNFNAGAVLSEPEIDSLAQQLTAAGNTSEARAATVRQVAEHTELKRREFKRAFVLMQYFGYLRRDPNSGPDIDFGGYQFWLNKLESFNGDYRRAEMVKAFISSTEYRARFGNP